MRARTVVAAMGEQPAAGKDKFPGDKAEDRDYDLIAALSSIPSIGQAWAYPADDPEYQELSVRYLAPSDANCDIHDLMLQCEGIPPYILRY